MAVYTNNYLGLPGLDYVQDAGLAFATILKVTREGKVHKKVDGTPGSLEFRYTSSGGKIEFNPNNPFRGPTIGRPNAQELEKISIKYKV